MSLITPHSVAVIGGGPAGLMAAEVLSAGGAAVHVFERMPSVGRKFLMAGKGGMNITHSEPLPAFIKRYGKAETHIAPMLHTFGPDALRDWIHTLGVETFAGSSGRIFPRDMKAAPLLRAWLHRLRESGVKFHVRHRWLGWNANNALRFSCQDNEIAMQADAVILALGGGSWPQLGSDGVWVPLLEQCGVNVAPLKPANCGFDSEWSTYFSTRFAGEPLKNVTMSYTDANGVLHRRQGDIMITASGIEGGLVYALSAGLRDEIALHGKVEIYLDLLPDHDLQRTVGEIAHPRGAKSMASHLQSRLGLKGVKAGLLRERAGKETYANPVQLGAMIKACSLTLTTARPLQEAISSAGGVAFSGLSNTLMLRNLPGVFCAGEMLDWEAPTGGYLLTACFASGRAAAQGALEWLKST